MAKINLSTLIQRKEHLRLRASQQRMALVNEMQGIAPLWRLSKLGLVAFGAIKGATSFLALFHLFRGKKRGKSFSRVGQFLYGLGLARKVMGLFRRRN